MGERMAGFDKLKIEQTLLEHGWRAEEEDGETLYSHILIKIAHYNPLFDIYEAARMDEELQRILKNPNYGGESDDEHNRH